MPEGVSQDGRMLVGSSKYLFYRSYWLAMASSLAVVLGAIGPWTRLGIRVDGPQDAAVLTLGCIAFFVLFLGGTDQRWIAAAPLVIGLTAAGIVANDIRDPTDVTPGPGRITSLHWGIYLALVGSATLVLASALLLVDSRRRVRARGAERRVGARAERGGPERRVGRDGRRLPPGSKNLFYREKEAAGVPVRVAKILSFCELRRTDRVLDAGCAEGLITLELAPYVEHIHGFDLSAFRIEEAKRLADERGIENASFEVESVIGYPVEPLSYDVTIFAGVWGSKGVGFTELDNLLKATRRQLVAFIDLRYHRARVAPMYDICERNGFDVLCFASKFVIALRRGAESSVPEAPAVAVVPSTMLADHPVLRNARSVEELVLDEEDSSGLPELRRRP